MDQRRKVIVFSSIFIVLSLIIVVLAVLFSSGPKDSDQETQVNQNSYYDANSGETVLNPEGREPEAVGNESSALILGLPILLDYGITTNQIEILKSKINIFSLEKKVSDESITEVSFSKNNITQSINKTSRVKTLSVKIEINRTYSYMVELEYLWDNQLTISIFDSSDKLIFSK